LEGFSYVLQIDMHFICTPMWTKFYSCKKWVLHIDISENNPLHLIFKDGLHHPTKCRAVVFETFGHPEITICAERCNTTSFFFILLAEPYLVVP
jgi:hypothetical protein